MGCCYDNPNPQEEKYNYFDNQYKNNTASYDSNDNYTNGNTYKKKDQNDEKNKQPQDNGNYDPYDNGNKGYVFGNFN